MAESINPDLMHFYRTGEASSGFNSVRGNWETLTRTTTGVDRTDGGILFAKHVRMRAIRHYVGNTATKLRPQTQIRSGA